MLDYEIDDAWPKAHPADQILAACAQGNKMVNSTSQPPLELPSSKQTVETNADPRIFAIEGVFQGVYSPCNFGFVVGHATKVYRNECRDGTVNIQYISTTLPANVLTGCRLDAQSLL